MIKEIKDYLLEVRISTRFYHDGLMNTQNLKKVLMSLYDQLDEIEAEKRNNKLKK